MYQVTILYDPDRNRGYYEDYVESNDDTLGNITVEELPPYADIKKAQSCWYDAENMQWVFDEDKYQSIVDGNLDDAKEQKIAEMNEAQQQIIRNGVDVTFLDGTTERFTLKDQDQTSLMGLQTQVALGADKIPWHSADQMDHCKYYSNSQMALILEKAMGFVTFHVTYFRDLRIYINGMQSKDEINAVEYGIYIPEMYQSEVLTDLYASMENA